MALARTRRMQRALAHAYLHRHAPLPTLRLSLGFMTTTVRTTEEVDGSAGLGHRMTVLGVARAEHCAYVIEELGGGELPIAYRLYLDGPRTGHLVPIQAWYERDPSEAQIRARIAKLAATLEPCTRTTTEAWMLSTRVVQRRALRVAGQDAPIRKFALQLRVEPVSGVGATGATTVTAFLRPDARLVDVMAIPGCAGMLARVAYTGVPSGCGLSKETVILMTE
ncbi:MAG TPA: hypothetical protein VFQ65_04170 [Kofleriaceae bacterium]|nr:hypothetical protein [Kofleriaceae bacterium]